MKYVFPRQFGLHNVFTSSVDYKETVQPFKDYTLREQEIHHRVKQDSDTNRTLRKVPKRLRGLPSKLISRIHKRHARCSYTSLLRHYCPLHTFSLPRHQLQQSLQPSDSTMAKSQLCATSMVGTLEENILSSTSELTSQLSLYEYACASSSVSAFCQAVICQLLPPDTMGTGEDGVKNRKQVMGHIDDFVCMRRFESLSMHTIMQNLKVKCRGDFDLS